MKNKRDSSEHEKLCIQNEESDDSSSMSRLMMPEKSIPSGPSEPFSSLCPSGPFNNSSAMQQSTESSDSSGSSESSIIEELIGIVN